MPDAGADWLIDQNTQLITRQKWTVIVCGCWLFSGGSRIGTMSTLKVNVWIKILENMNKLDSRESLNSIIDLSRLIEKISWPHFLCPPQNTGDFSFLFPCKHFVIGVIGVGQRQEPSWRLQVGPGAFRSTVALSAELPILESGSGWPGNAL